MAFSELLEGLQSMSGPALLAGTGALVIGEAIVGLGFVIPGEAALLLASATVDSIQDFLVLWLVATICSLIGNIIGFEMGRRVGPSLRSTRLIHKYGGERWDKAANLLNRKGKSAVFVGRLIPLIRSFVPAVAGAAGIPYRTFLPAVSAAAALATALPILFAIGVVAGARSLGGETVAAICLIALAIASVTYVVRRQLHKSRSASSHHDPASSASAQSDLEPGERARVSRPNWRDRVGL
ncbi:DedA family protein [Streptomyces griseus]|uniref:DedA family protein n=1 Tax=Streptomyces griseus TaxID=1911 RepID=UPI0034461595